MRKTDAFKLLGLSSFVAHSHKAQTQETPPCLPSNQEALQRQIDELRRNRCAAFHPDQYSRRTVKLRPTDFLAAPEIAADS